MVSWLPGVRSASPLSFKRILRYFGVAGLFEDFGIGANRKAKAFPQGKGK
jgi:hypothetical protein